MPVDVEAKVIRNTRLSSDYNVIALAAPEIAAADRARTVRHGQARPRQRSAAAPAVLGLRDSALRTGASTGLSLLSKRVGVTTRMLLDAVDGDVVSCLGPLGKPFEPVDPPAQAWMVAGGVGLAPFATLTEVLRERGTETTLFYGARTRTELFYLDWFASRGVRAGAHAPKTAAPGERGTGDGSTRARAASRPTPTVMVYACGPEPMLEAVAHVAARYRPAVAGVGRTRDGLRNGRLLQLRHPGARSGRRPPLRPLVHLAVRCSRRPTWSGIMTGIDLSVRHRRAALANPLIAASGCYGYGVEYADAVDLSIAGRSCLEGPVPRAARRTSASAHRRDAVRHAQRHRPAGHRRASLHRRKAAGAAAARRDQHHQHLRQHARRVRRARSNPLGCRGRARARAQYLLPEYQGRRDHVRMQSARHVRCRQRR